jgi:hypothetical protein
VATVNGILLLLHGVPIVAVIPAVAIIGIFTVNGISAAVYICDVPIADVLVAGSWCMRSLLLLGSLTSLMFLKFLLAFLLLLASLFL